MSHFIECFGLQYLTDTEEKVRSFFKSIIEESSPIFGYYKMPYLNKRYGEAQFILRTERNEEQTSYEIAGFDTHCAGPYIWEGRLSAIPIKKEVDDVLQKRCVLTKLEDGTGMAVVNIVNADVLPSFCEDDYVRLQMVAFPIEIDYFQEEEQYVALQPSLANGKKLVQNEGMIYPAGLLSNLGTADEDSQPDHGMDDYVVIWGKVKKLLNGELQLGEKRFNGFIRCVIDTEFGDLEIIHTAEQLKADQMDVVKVGAIVSGLFVLSGDAAIYEYERGCIFDEAHDLALLRYVFLGGDAERLRSALADDAIYVAGASGKQYVGKDEIIKQMIYVQQNAEDTYYAHMATIEEVEERETLPVAEPGKRCIVLAFGEETNLDAIAFIETNTEGKIYQIITSRDDRYRFLIDAKPYKSSLLDDILLPESVIRSILSRARYHGIIDDQISDEEVACDNSQSVQYKYNAEQMMNALNSSPEAAGDEALRNTFGYLFAKAIEAKYSEGNTSEPSEMRLLVSYSPTDAWRGRLETQVDANRHEKLIAAMNLGNQFYTDFSLFHPTKDSEDTEYDEDLLNSLIAVQQLGALYMKVCMGL